MYPLDGHPIVEHAIRKKRHGDVTEIRTHVRTAWRVQRFQLYHQSGRRLDVHCCWAHLFLRSSYQIEHAVTIGNQEARVAVPPPQQYFRKTCRNEDICTCKNTVRFFISGPSVYMTTRQVHGDPTGRDTRKHLNKAVMHREVHVFP